MVSGHEGIALCTGVADSRARSPVLLERENVDNSPASHSATRWIEREVEGDTSVLYLKGIWRLPNAAAISQALLALHLQARGLFILDGSGLEALDTAAGFILLRHLADIGCTEAMVSARGFDPRYQRLLALVHERMTTPAAAGYSERHGLVQGIGAATFKLWRLVRTHTAFIGLVVLEMLELLRRPGIFRPKETVSQFQSVCLDAIPIVVLSSFLIGVVIAYVFGVEARNYGATLFVADGVGLAVVRELSPILGSALIAGRSGSAFTAQIGTMKVEEEIEAITTLGLSPIQVLVIPRLIALMIALPLLVFIGDIGGIAGGMLVGAWWLDIAPHVFLDRVHGIVQMQDFMAGLVKAPVFAAFITIIACRMGMLVARDARSVGVNTTSTVVQSLVWVIVLDAGFAVAFQKMGI